MGHDREQKGWAYVTSALVRGRPSLFSGLTPQAAKMKAESLCEDFERRCDSGSVPDEPEDMTEEDLLLKYVIEERDEVKVSALYSGLSFYTGHIRAIHSQ